LIAPRLSHNHLRLAARGRIADAGLSFATISMMSVNS